MKPSLIVPPSIFYTQIIPSLKNKDECYFYINMLQDYYHFLTDFIFEFNFKTSSLTSPAHYKTLSDERTNVILYIQELQEVAKSLD